MSELTDLSYLFEPEDKRPPKHGWESGGYTCKCRCCGKMYAGRKRSYHCADCAYNFDEQLAYEFLWSNVGWPYALEYSFRKMAKHKDQS